MSALAADKRIWTPEEYLAWERDSPEKHAFYRGEVFAMAGASRAHNLLVGNIVRLLGNALLERPCESYPSDMRVRIQATGLYTYPDATALCQRPVFEDSAAKPAAKVGRPAKASSGSAASAAKHRSGGKRSPDHLAQVTERAGNHIKANPGQGMEQIAKALSTTSKELRLPLHKLLGDKKITSTGQKRAMRYFPK